MEEEGHMNGTVNKGCGWKWPRAWRSREFFRAEGSCGPPSIQDTVLQLVKSQLCFSRTSFSLGCEIAGWSVDSGEWSTFTGPGPWLMAF